ncbi:MAG: hypothetical protein AB8H79_06505 [Myxococcota bacterium]
MMRLMVVLLAISAGCGKKQGPEGAVSGTTGGQTGTSTAGSDTPTGASTQSRDDFRAPTDLTCDDAGADEPVRGPDCVTAEIECGDTIIGHTKGGVDRYNTRFYEANFCWPGTRNHNGGDERVYVFRADKTPRFKAGETRQRVSVTFSSPCADLTFTSMEGEQGVCPSDGVRICDTANPFTRKRGQSVSHLTVDEGEVYYFLVEGADEEEGAFSISVECGT